jgi:hypothetical protein
MRFGHLNYRFHAAKDIIIREPQSNPKGYARTKNNYPSLEKNKVILPVWNF